MLPRSVRFGIALTLVLTLIPLSACYWPFATLEADIWCACMPNSDRGFVFCAEGSHASWTKIREYIWDFGDGFEKTGKTTTHIYAAEGIYTVTLTVGNGHGLTATDTTRLQTNGYPPNEAPTASFTASPTEGDAPLEVNLDASASADGDGSIGGFDWDFGDNSTGAGETTSHVYEEPGTYTVTLTVEDEEGATDVATREIRVLDGGAPANDQPSAAFTATPTEGMVPLLVQFDATDSEDPDGEIATYYWDFGDGATLADGMAMPSHIYTSEGEFSVELTVVDDRGASDSATVTIDVDAAATSGNEEPNASFSAEPRSGDVPLLVDFDAGSSSDPDGYLATYYWDFGDGEVLADGIVEPSHVYSAPGTYDATLTVIDNSGASDSQSKRITVHSTNEAPTAWFTATPETGEAPLEVDFDASASTDGDGVIVDYDWNFGDGDTGNGVTPSHTYGTPGTYTATVTVEDNEGASDDATRQIEVAAPPIPQDLYVDAEGGDDDTGDGSEGNPYKTITKALSVIPDDDGLKYTVHLAAGIYNSALGEDFPLLLDGVNLVGEGAAVDDVKIAGEMTMRSCRVAHVALYRLLEMNGEGDLELDTCWVIGIDPGNGVIVEPDSPEAEVTIVDCRFQDNQWALGLWGEGLKTVSSSTFINNYAAISAHYGQSVVEDCVVDSGIHSYGVTLSFSRPATLEMYRTTVTSEYNSFYTSAAGGKLLMEGCDLTCDRAILLHGSEALAVDLGGGPQGSSGGNTFTATEYCIKDERPAFSGSIWAKSNTWNDPQPLGTAIGPADVPANYLIENEGNSIIFSE